MTIEPKQQRAHDINKTCCCTYRSGRVHAFYRVRARGRNAGGFILKRSNEHDGVLVLLQDGTAKRAQGKPHRLASEGWVRARHSCSAALYPSATY